MTETASHKHFATIDRGLPIQCETLCLVQFGTMVTTLIYTARKSLQGNGFKSSIPRDVFFDLAKKAEDQGEQ